MPLLSFLRLCDNSLMSSDFPPLILLNLKQSKQMTVRPRNKECNWWVSNYLRNAETQDLLPHSTCVRFKRKQLPLSQLQQMNLTEPGFRNEHFMFYVYKTTERKNLKACFLQRIMSLYHSFKSEHLREAL